MASAPGRQVHFQHVELSFDGVPNEDEQRFLRGIETSFRLSDKKVDHLIQAARQLVRDSNELDEALAPFRDKAVGH